MNEWWVMNALVHYLPLQYDTIKSWCECTQWWRKWSGDEARARRDKGMKINFIIEFPLPFTPRNSSEDMSAVWFDYAARKIDLV